MRSRICFLLVFVLLGLLPGMLHAQATKIFVASYGNDANDGSRGSPKRNFQAAHNAVAANGQIVVLDTAGYGALNITKSLAVTVPPGVNGFVTVPLGTTAAITINAAATDKVALRGLIVEGGANRSTQSGGTNYGIYAPQVGTLTVVDCVIRNFYDGLLFGTTTGPDSQINVFNTEVNNCRFGIDIETNSQALAFGLIAGCRILDNGTGFYTAAPLAYTYVTLKDCFLANNNLAMACNNYAVVVVSKCTFFKNNTVTARGDAAYVATFGNNTLSYNNSTLDIVATRSEE